MVRAIAAPDPANFRNVHSILRRHAERVPDKIFLESIDQGTNITWDKLWRLSNQLAGLFRDKGIHANDRIVVLSENSLENLVLFFAILRYGATFCTINVEINAAHLRDMLRHLNPNLVLWSEFLDSSLIGAGTSDDWISFGLLGECRGLFTMLSAYSGEDDAACVADPEDVAVINFTSGTAATPKAVMHSFSNYYWIAEQTIDMWGLSDEDRLLEYRSFSWASSHMLCLMPCLVSGATLIFGKKFSQSHFFEWIRKYQPTIAIGTPTILNMLLERSLATDSTDFHSLRFMSCSTAPLILDQHRKFEDLYQIKLMQLYGMSEGGVIAGNYHNDYRFGSVGRPGNYQNLKIIDNNGKSLSANGIGEIEIGGAQNAYGYLIENGEIEKIRGNRLSTGDIGYLDEDGFLFITGRVKDIIIRGGVNIAPLEIDNVLMRHADIKEVATVGVPDDVYGEEVVSFITIASDSRVTEQEVIAHCAETLPEFKLPKHIVFAAGIPKNQRGKIDRSSLVEDWKKKRRTYSKDK